MKNGFNTNTVQKLQAKQNTALTNDNTYENKIQITLHIRDMNQPKKNIHKTITHSLLNKQRTE